MNPKYPLPTSTFAGGMARLGCVLVLSLLVASLLPAQSDPVDPAQASAWLQQVDSWRQYRSGGYSFDFGVSDSDSGKSIMRVFIKAGGSDTAVSRYLEPAKSRGRAVLMIGNSFWLWEPGMASALRISPRQMLFGQAAAGDVTRISFAAMYSVRESQRDGEHLLLKLQALPGHGATYDAVDLTVDAADGRPRRAECRGSSGVLIKTIDYQGFALVGDKELLSKFSIKDEASGKLSIVTLGNFTASTLSEANFTVQALKNPK